jgi:hypothetical protein
MSEQESVDFFFRYRPAADSPDGVLLRYLLSYNPTQRKHMILKALRAFYLVAAYGELGEFEQFGEVKKLMKLLEETYGEDAIGSFKHSLTLDIDIGVNYLGYSTMSGEREDEQQNELPHNSNGTN